MNNRLTIKDSLKQLLRDYQTRQHLRHLPTHLFKDIARTPKQINNEINKSGFIALFIFTFRRLIKGD
ncbi:hypothetical protein GCM10007916_13290 [Psychromonas marina]|uniref:DUF4372 domain-containing protein n=1 Tax=Psychromonas marina TaxID=88364 RepID=A0ABQ6DYN4_9GAMM|nr:hypothetical protein [Psychromonas marina]GLS90262.1 hypothetical protein GCM10007916_13290 [Psychromonas marina]